MHSSSLGARPGGFLCRYKLSSQGALHKHHNLNNLGIRQKFSKTYSEKSILFFKLFGKIDFQIHKNLKNRLVFLKVFGKIDFIDYFYLLVNTVTVTTQALPLYLAFTLSTKWHAG